MKNTIGRTTTTHTTTLRVIRRLGEGGHGRDTSRGHGRDTGRDTSRDTLGTPAGATEGAAAAAGGHGTSARARPQG